MDGLSQASMIPSSLEKQLIAALKLREVRQIRRVLPPSADTALVDFSSNDYLSLSKSTELRNRFLEKLGSTERILGSGGSRLLINGSAHVDLEDRLQFFFSGIDAAQQRGQTPSPAPTLDALLFNSGFDANVGFFACVPQPGDFVVYDEYIHASVHDGMRMSRAKCVPFQHNSVEDLEKVLLGLKTERTEMFDGNGSVFIAVEGLYSMDGTIPPLEDIVQLAESAFPKGNAYVSVDEAHSTGIYGPNGRGLVNLLGLQDRVFARLHTFGKALAGTGGELLCSDPVESPLMYGIAVLLVPPIVKQYLINYARTLIYTTSLSYANIISANCSFDLLESGRADEVRSCF
jgi:8-amino-7-oxononanoate synthase